MASHAGAAGEATTVKKRQRKIHPSIDLDTTIEKARRAVIDAQRAMREARQTAKNERRRRARLIRKAATLSAKDLDRIAVLKRCGMWDPAADDAPEDKRARVLGLGSASDDHTAGRADTQTSHNQPADAVEDDDERI